MGLRCGVEDNRRQVLTHEPRPNQRVVEGASPCRRGSIYHLRRWTPIGRSLRASGLRNGAADACEAPGAVVRPNDNVERQFRQRPGVELRPTDYAGEGSRTCAGLTAPVVRRMLRQCAGPFRVMLLRWRSGSARRTATESCRALDEGCRSRGPGTRTRPRMCGRHTASFPIGSLGQEKSASGVHLRSEPCPAVPRAARNGLRAVRHCNTESVRLYSSNTLLQCEAVVPHPISQGRRHRVGIGICKVPCLPCPASATSPKTT